MDGWTVAVIGPEKGRRVFVGWNADRKVIEDCARRLRADWQTGRLAALRPTSIRVRRMDYDAWNAAQRRPRP